MKEINAFSIHKLFTGLGGRSPQPRKDTMKHLILASIIVSLLTGCRVPNPLTDYLFDPNDPAVQSQDDGYMQATSWIAMYDRHYAFGSDNSIWAFLKAFEIPLVWNQFQDTRQGDVVTDADFRDYSKATIANCTEPDFKAFYQFHRGAWKAFMDW